MLRFIIFLILIIFPTQAFAYSGSLSHTAVFTPGSTEWWQTFGLLETDVFHSSLKHTEDYSNSWEIRIGKGSQIYSIRTAAGELIGAQNPNGGFIDRVLQQVLIDTTQNTDANPYFIHQAGNYARDGLTKAWFSPLLSSKFDNIDHLFTTTSWPQQAHVPIAFQSNIIMEQKVKDLGDGVIEVTYITHNFGTNTINRSNEPWLAIKKSSLPKIILSQTNGQTVDVQGNWDQNRYKIDDTNGYLAFTNGITDQAIGLGVVFGKDKHIQELNHPPSIIRLGTTTNEDLSILSRIYTGVMLPGQSYFFKYYLIVNTLDKIKTYGSSLSNQADYGPIIYNETDSPLRPLCLDKSTLMNCPPGKTVDINAYQHAISDSKPLFVLKETTTGKIRLSDNPYLISSKPYDGKTQYISYLGWFLSQDKTNLTPRSGTCPLYKSLSEFIDISDLKIKNLVGRTNYNLDCISTTPPTTTTIDKLGDANYDQTINMEDFDTWKNEYLRTTTTSKSDFSKNGIVDMADFTIWKKEYLADTI